MHGNPKRMTAKIISPTPETIDIGRVLDEGGWGRYQKLVWVLTALSIIIDGIDNQLLGIAIPAVMKDWGVARSAFAPVLAVGFVGMMIGGAVAGIMGDRLGRRVALLCSVLVFGITTISTCLVNNLFVFGVLRFLAGVGLQGATPNAAALVSEYVPLRHRPFAVTATIVCIPLGATVAGLLAIPVLPNLGWRALFVIGGLIPIGVALLLMRFLPESPRYLARHPERWPELVRILRRIGHNPAPDAVFADAGEKAVVRVSAKALLQPEWRLDTVALWGSFFFCLLAVYTGMNWVPSMLTGAGLSSTIANAGITAYNLGGVAGAIGGALAIARYGSKRTMLTMTGGAVACALVMRSMTIAVDSSAFTVVLMLGITGGLINAVQTTMYALAAHVYPTTVRATGVGVASSTGRLGGILSTYAGAWALEVGGSPAFFTVIGAAMGAVFGSLALVRRHIPGQTEIVAAGH